MKDSEITRLERLEGQSVRKLAAQVLHQCKEKACWNFFMTLGKSIPHFGLQLLLFVGWANATQ